MLRYSPSSVEPPARDRRALRKNVAYSAGISQTSPVTLPSGRERQGFVQPHATPFRSFAGAEGEAPPIHSIEYDLGHSPRMAGPRLMAADLQRDVAKTRPLAGRGAFRQTIAPR